MIFYWLIRSIENRLSWITPGVGVYSPKLDFPGRKAILEPPESKEGDGSSFHFGLSGPENLFPEGWVSALLELGASGLRGEKGPLFLLRSLRRCMTT